jgi:hypothetical protein
MKSKKAVPPLGLTEEQYKFHKLAGYDLQNAELALERIPTCNDRFIQHALIKDAVISYAKPFFNSQGTYRNNYQLSSKFVSKEFKDLHKTILSSRKEVFVHTDLTARTLEIARIKGKIEYMYIVSVHGLSPDEFLPLIPKMKELVKSVRDKNNQAMIEIQRNVFDKIPSQPEKKSPTQDA